MMLLQTLRRGASLARVARLVLAWFALSLGVAVASPLLSPSSIALVCTGSGAMKLVVKTAGDDAPQGVAALDCPLCASAGAPPSVQPALMPALPAQSGPPQRRAGQQVPAVLASPLGARAPPVAA